VLLRAQENEQLEVDKLAAENTRAARAGNSAGVGMTAEGSCKSWNRRCWIGNWPAEVGSSVEEATNTLAEVVRAGSLKVQVSKMPAVVGTEEKGHCKRAVELGIESGVGCKISALREVQHGKRLVCRCEGRNQWALLQVEGQKRQSVQRGGRPARSSMHHHRC